jgi:hypothetical protein
MADNSASFVAPIPGQGLTSELGSRPWQQPPKYNTVDEALAYYIPRLSTEEQRDNFYPVLESGIPVAMVVNTLLTGGVMRGLHSVDVSVLLTPVLVEFISLMADYDNVDYTTGLEKNVDSDKINPAMVQAALRKYRDMKPEELEAEPEMEDSEDDDMDDMDDMPAAGLMARR